MSLDGRTPSIRSWLTTCLLIGGLLNRKAFLVEYESWRPADQRSSATPHQSEFQPDDIHIGHVGQALFSQLDLFDTDWR